MQLSDQQKIDVRRPFRRADGLRAGIPRGTLDGPGFRRLGHGVLVSAAVPDSPRLRAEAALVPFPGTAYASHASAARVWQVPIPTLPDEHVTVADRADRRKRAGLRCHVRVGADVCVVDGVPVSTLPDLFVELADLLGLVDLVVVGDWMLRRRGVSVEQLRAAVEAASGATARRARAALGYVRPEVDSPMETRLRMLLVLAGIPEPEINLEIRNVDGEVIRRYDLCWPGVKVIVEYDGRQHVEREEDWEDDLDRREEIDDDHWRILVVVARGIYREPERTVRRVHRLLRRRGLPGLPVRPRDDWRPHFPGWSSAA